MIMPPKMVPIEEMGPIEKDQLLQTDEGKER